MQTLYFEGRRHYIQMALLSMQPGWALQSIGELRRLLVGLNGTDGELQMVRLCQRLSEDLSRQYINKVIHKNDARPVEWVNCLYNPEQQEVTINIPLDNTESRFIKIVIGRAENDELSCLIKFDEEAVRCFAPMANKMWWGYHFGEAIVWVDRDKKMKWRHLASIGNTWWHGWMDPFEEAVIDEIDHLWKERHGETYTPGWDIARSSAATVHNPRSD